MKGNTKAGLFIRSPTPRAPPPQCQPETVAPDPKDAAEAAWGLEWLPNLSKDPEKHSVSSNVESALFDEISLARPFYASGV